MSTDRDLLEEIRNDVVNIRVDQARGFAEICGRMDAIEADRLDDRVTALETKDANRSGQESERDKAGKRSNGLAMGGAAAGGAGLLASILDWLSRHGWSVG
jgi:hypothetical protein